MSKTEARRILGWPEDIPIIGYIGAIFKRDADLMLDAFDLVRQARSNAQLLLLGYFNIPIEKQFADPSAIQRTGPIDRDQFVSISLRVISVGCRCATALPIAAVSHSRQGTTCVLDALS